MSQRPSHADGSPSMPAVPEPSYAERARTLVAKGGISTLSTMSEKHPGFPFGSVMPFGLTDAGEPVFLISSMAMHTKNLRADPKCTLLVMDKSTPENPLGAGRLSIMGEALPVSDDAKPAIRELYLDQNPNAKNWVDYGDFGFFKMTVIDSYFVGGFGVMGWVDGSDYLNAEADPLLGVSDGIIQHMNDDHAEALVELANHHTEFSVQTAHMTSIDRLGFHVRLQTAEGAKGIRIAFPKECITNDSVRTTFIAMLKEIRSTPT